MCSIKDHFDSKLQGLYGHEFSHSTCSFIFPLASIKQHLLFINKIVRQYEKVEKENFGASTMQIPYPNNKRKKASQGQPSAQLAG